MTEWTKIDWADHTFNPWIGCQKVSTGCDNCLAPETLVLYRDWTWRPLSEVQVGDELLGFPESGGTLMRRLEVSTVEKIWPVRTRALEIRTPDHSIVASYEHPFVARKTSRAWRWREPHNFSLLTTYLRTLEVAPREPFSTEYMRGYLSGATGGYLSGATEGDGTFRLSEERQSYWRVAVRNTQNQFLERLADFLKKLETAELGVKPFRTNQGTAPMIRIETRRRDHLERIEKILGMAHGEVSRDFARGWLAGMFDAEGSSGITNRKSKPGKIRQNSLRIANTVDERIEKIARYGKITGFDFKVEKYSKHCYTAQLQGGAAERGRFYGTVRPALDYKVNSCLHTEVPAKESQVVAMSDVGEIDLIDIQTSTGTFFANSFAVHNCYAEALTDRYGWTEWGAQGERVRTSDNYWKQPLRWEHRAAGTGVKERVFCASLADVFDNQAPAGAREELWDLIRATRHLEWLLLTKRPQNMAEMLPPGWETEYGNVWLGVSAEDQEEYDRRWPILAATPAAVRFVSYEPALGPLSILGHPTNPDWLIWGGESGPRARRTEEAWIRAVTAECVDRKIPAFGKQWGRYENNPLTADGRMTTTDAKRLDPPENGKGGALLDKKLWRQFPK